MNCGNYFRTEVPKQKSTLYTQLLRKYKSRETADYIYESIIKSGVWNENSFLNFLDYKVKTDGAFETTIQGEPSLNTFLEWIEYGKKKAAINKVFVTNNLTTSPLEFLSMAQGFTSLIPQTLKEKGMSMIDLASGKTNLKNVWNDTFSAFTDMFQENIDGAKKESAKKRARLILKEVKENRGLFLSAYNEYLSGRLNIRFDESTDEFGVYDERIVDSEHRTHKDTTFDKRAEEFSPIEAAPKAIKLMIASMVEVNPETKVPLRDPKMMNFPKLVNYSRTAAMIHQTLAEVPADIELFLEELRQNLNSFPELQQLIDQVNFHEEEFRYDSDPEKKMSQQLLRTQFVNHFDKSRYNYTIHVLDRDGNMKVVDANLDKASDLKINEWHNNLIFNMNADPSMYTDEYIRERIDIKSKGRLSNSEFLEWLGVKPEAGENRGEFYARFPASIVTAIRDNGVPNASEIPTIYQRKKKHDVRARMVSIANIAAKNDRTIIELQHYNPEGKLVYGISLNTYLTNKVKNLRYWAGDIEALEKSNPELFLDPYIGSSIFVQLVKNQADNKLQVGIATGFKSDINSQSEETSNLNERDLAIQRMYNILQEGHYHLPRAADRKIENIFFFEGLRGRGELMSGGGLIADVTDNYSSAVYYLIRHLQDEIKANQEYGKLDVKNLSLIDANTTRVFTLDNGKSIFEKRNLQNKSYDELLSNDGVKAFINRKIEEIVATERQFLSDEGITAADMPELIEEYGSFENVIKNYAINHFLGTIETTKMFIGDPRQYDSPSDFFKRMSMLNSTKEATRTDQEMNDYIKSLDNNLEISNNYPGEREGSVISTITLQDIISDINEGYSSEESNTIKRLLKDNNGYENIKEPDGFAVVTYDEYRIMKIRYGQWDTIDEELYQELTTNPDYVIKESHIGRIFPDKSQYVGRLRNEEYEDYNIIGGRKFAFMPLVPGLFKKGSILDKLNSQMLANGVGMAFFESAAKFGHKVDKKNKALHSIYDEDGNFNIKLDYTKTKEFDILDYSEMGNQLKLRKAVDKGKFVTESTQKRKINLSNFLIDGQVDENLPDAKGLKEKIDNYNKIQNEKVRRAYNTLSRKLGFKELEKITEDTTEEEKEEIIRKSVNAFIESITNMAKLQGFTSNELKAIQELQKLPFFDILPNKSRVEQFVTAKLRNSVIRQKRRGEALAQMSNVGFEMPGERSRHDLKFYRIKKVTNSEGITSEIMLPMEIYAPLPTELHRYVSAKYNNGKGLTVAAIEEFNRDIAEDNQRYEETGDMEDLTKLTMLAGFRIPYQAPSSGDVGKVKAFYPPYLSGMVVVPKALVVKAGSDFDIDKLNMYYPEIVAHGDTGFQIARQVIKDNIPNTRSLIRVLQEEDIGYDHKSQDAETLEKWFIDGVLQASYGDMQSIFGKNYNQIYQETVKRLAPESAQLKYVDVQYVPISQMSDKELSNFALENEIELTLHPANWKQLLTPLGDKKLKGIRKDIIKETEESKKESWSDIFSAKTNIQKMIAFLAGKAGVGQTAVHTTNHINAQRAGLKAKAYHDFFKSSKIIKPVKLEESNQPEVKELNQLVSKPDMNLSFEKPADISTFEGKRRAKALEKLEPRAKELQNTIDRLWSEEKC